MNSLNHLAIIMDGNGRWAKKRGFLRTKGHENGALVIEQICEFCLENNVKILSLYAFSTENWKRPKSEVNFLMNLLKDFLISRKDSFIKNGISFNIIGDISILSDELKTEISNLKNMTSKNRNLKLNLAINYGAHDEIARAMQKIAINTLRSENYDLKNDQKFKDRIAEIFNTKTISSTLDESAQIDLLIRTGGEKRLSNFMLWQASYAELAFSKTLWPDFSKAELAKIVTEFKCKNRRFGGV